MPKRLVEGIANGVEDETGARLGAAKRRLIRLAPQAPQSSAATSIELASASQQSPVVE